MEWTNQFRESAVNLQVCSPVTLLFRLGVFQVCSLSGSEQVYTIHVEEELGSSRYMANETVLSLSSSQSDLFLSWYLWSQK